MRLKIALIAGGVHHIHSRVIISTGITSEHDVVESNALRMYTGAFRKGIIGSVARHLFHVRIWLPFLEARVFYVYFLSTSNAILKLNMFCFFFKLHVDSYHRRAFCEESLTTLTRAIQESSRVALDRMMPYPSWSGRKLKSPPTRTRSQASLVCRIN